MTTRKVSLNSSPYLCDSGMHSLIMRPQFVFQRLSCLLGKCYPEGLMSSEYMTSPLHPRSRYELGSGSDGGKKKKGESASGKWFLRP